MFAMTLAQKVLQSYNNFAKRTNAQAKRTKKDFARMMKKQ